MEKKPQNLKAVDAIALLVLRAAAVQKNKNPKKLRMLKFCFAFVDFGKTLAYNLT